MAYRILLGLLLTIAATGATTRNAVAQQSDAAAQQPEPPSNKVTLAYYHFSSGKLGVDAYFRHTFSSSTAWIGVYHENDGFDQARVGYEYDYHSHWLTLVPSVQAATHDFVGATIYSEVGVHLFGIGGFGRTNLQPYWNLGFDPNDYIQAGAGYRDAAGNTIEAYAIHDDRLGTGQTNTHVTLRRYLPDTWRLTLDVVNERGRGEDDIDINTWAVSVDANWRRWFVRVAEDPHVNYTADHQVRIAGGCRF